MRVFSEISQQREFEPSNIGVASSEPNERAGE
jgi:hypothetical protein